MSSDTRTIEQQEISLTLTNDVAVRDGACHCAHHVPLVRVVISRVTQDLDRRSDGEPGLGDFSVGNFRDLAVFD